MKNRFHLLATAVVSLLCVSCAETQVSQSGSEKAVNPPIMGWSSWNAFRVDISEDIIKNQADLMVKKGLKDAGYHYGEFYQFNLSSCIRQQNSLTAQFVSFSLSNLANIFYPPNFYNN